jgi:phage shock protein A
LLSGNDASVDALDLEIATLRKQVDRHDERLRLLEAEAKRVEDERAATKRRHQVDRNDATLNKSLDPGAEAEEAIATLDKACRRLIEMRMEVAAAWPFDANQQSACYLADIERTSHDVHLMPGATDPAIINERRFHA